jgi:hypothetical protein
VLIFGMRGGLGFLAGSLLFVFGRFVLLAARLTARAALRRATKSRAKTRRLLFAIRGWAGIEIILRLPVKKAVRRYQRRKYITNHPSVGSSSDRF